MVAPLTVACAARPPPRTSGTASACDPTNVFIGPRSRICYRSASFAHPANTETDGTSASALSGKSPTYDIVDPPRTSHSRWDSCSHAPVRTTVQFPHPWRARETEVAGPGTACHGAGCCRSVAGTHRTSSPCGSRCRSPRTRTGRACWRGMSLEPTGHTTAPGGDDRHDRTGTLEEPHSSAGCGAASIRSVAHDVIHCGAVVPFSSTT